jgi:signal transduction histidine kinase/ActR/RegA family two-component response regulator
MFKQIRLRLVIVSASHLVGTAAIALLFPVLGSVAGVFGMAAVLVGAFCFGRRGGLVTAAVQAVLNALVMQFLVYPAESFSSSAALGIGFMFLAGAAVGCQRDLSRRLRDELVRNERLRVREKETLAAIPDVMIRARPDGTSLLQGADVPDGLAQVLERVLGHAPAAEQQAALADVVTQVRSTGQAKGLTIELQGTACYDVRCLPAAEASVLVVLRDVTEQRRLLRRVAAAENLASLGTLAAGLAHEVNNPLTYIITNIYTVKLRLGEAGKGVKAELNAALDGCWRIRDLVRNMLETSTSKRDIIEPVSVSEVVETALALVTPQVRHRATISWTPEAELYATAHRTRLVQVVVNLVVNASQAFADNRTSANEIGVRVRGEGKQVVLEVDDNGMGMDEATRLRALEPFFTTKEPGQGTGLGLFLCNSIVESLGGRLQIDSELGKGTKVTVRLPMAQEAPVARRNRRRPGQMSTGTAPRLRVLVVDDEPEIRRGLQRILREKHDVFLCGNGAEALERLTAGERYDVILCDLLMPEMTGIELFAEIERRFREQADGVVFLTGGATSESSRVFIEQQSARVVSKPFHPAEIMAVVLARAHSPLPTPTPIPIPSILHES